MTNEEFQKKRRKARKLDNYANFDVHRWSSYPEVKTATDQLYVHLKTNNKFKGNTKIQKKHLRVLLLDLFANWLTDSKKYIAIYRGNDFYEQGIYNALHISRQTVPLMDILREEGYIQYYPGYFKPEDEDGSKKTRIKVTLKLVNFLIKTHQLSQHMIERSPNEECIILRGIKERKINTKTGKPRKTKTSEQIDYTKDKKYDNYIPVINKMRKNVYAYNNLLRRTFIDIPHFPKEGIPTRSKKRKIRIDLTQKFVARIFNNDSFQEGGRYWGGWWQRLSSKWRKRIRINDRKVVEIDYSGIHIVMLYALKNIDYWSKINTDPYNIKGLEQSERMRDLLKVVLLSSINAENRIKTKQAIQHEINWDKNLYQWSLSKKLDLNDILDKFVSTHAPIKEYFFSGKGIELQNTDSRIAEMVVNHCTRHHIPVLCIHDSFVIEQRHKQLLQDIMNKSFEVVLKEFLTTGSIATSKLKIEEYNQPKQESVRRVLTTGKAKPIPQDVINQLNQITREKRIVMWKPKMKMLIDFDRWNVEDDDYDNLLRKRDKEYILRKKLHNRIEWEKNYYKDSYRDYMKEV
jgi:hypothetical protein